MGSCGGVAVGLRSLLLVGCEFGGLVGVLNRCEVEVFFCFSGGVLICRSEVSG